MTYPKPGEIVLTDPTTGDVVRETWDHIDGNEHYVVCIDKSEKGHNETVKKVPWRRVVAVIHRYDEADDGGRKIVDPTEETDE